jgi:hypothetical protein
VLFKIPFFEFLIIFDFFKIKRMEFWIVFFTDDFTNLFPGPVCHILRGN